MKLIGKEFLRNEVKLAWRETSVRKELPMLLLPGLRSRALAEAVHWSTRRARAEVVNSPKIGTA